MLVLVLYMRYRSACFDLVCVLKAIVLSLQVLRMVKCCFAAGCSGTYSDDVG